MTSMPFTEAAFQRQVIQLAQLLGYRCAHFRTSLNARGKYQTAVGADGAGYPDLTLVGRGRVLWCELKSDRGHTSPAQDDWHAVLRANGAEVYVWRPRQWDELKGILEGAPCPD